MERSLTTRTRGVNERTFGKQHFHGADLTGECGVVQCSQPGRGPRVDGTNFFINQPGDDPIRSLVCGGMYEQLTLINNTSQRTPGLVQWLQALERIDPHGFSNEGINQAGNPIDLFPLADVRAAEAERDELQIPVPTARIVVVDSQANGFELACQALAQIDEI